jgi:hypothetical protein
MFLKSFLPFFPAFSGLFSVALIVVPSGSGCHKTCHFALPFAAPRTPLPGSLGISKRQATH